MNEITLEKVSAVIAPHAPIYRTRAPMYQTAMLRDLAELWREPHARVLDVGGGTGLIAEAIQSLLPVGRVTAVDVVNRYVDTLSVETDIFDGKTLPFADGAYDAATINNVVHHVPVAVRHALMREVRRVVSGPVYIKDHVAHSRLDHMRLKMLDAIGNIPFGGQISADYLTVREWDELAERAGYRIAATASGRYRRGAMALLFPNRLEATFRLDRA